MTTPYSEIRNDLKTGDLVLYSGKGAFSQIIKLVTQSRWSHVGMVLQLKEYDFLATWESTTESKLKDLVSGKILKGVQLVPLSARIQEYGGDIVVRQLKNVELGREQIQDLMKLRKELRGRPYEEDKMELLKAAYDGPWGDNEEDLSSIFCSELVAEAYQRLGLLSQRKPSNEYTPADFSGNRRLRLLKGALDKEIELVWER